MTRMEILKYPDERLRQVAERVTVFDEHLAELAYKMIDLMHEKKGIGLAAPQVGESIRLIVVSPSGKPGDDYVLVNPEVAPLSGTETCEEGCLSFPGIYAPVQRPNKIFRRAQNLTGERVEFEAEGLMARIIMHECDHLNGVLFIDRLSLDDILPINSKLRELERRKKM
ncbi:MAG: peptide deformylase [Planctomycetota bacterium]|nr:peptide deformylase [Planctomycetota bacterium]